jgi:DNA-directed RNA polymerase specialized sigma24 family protein
VAAPELPELLYPDLDDLTPAHVQAMLGEARRVVKAYARKVFWLRGDTQREVEGACLLAMCEAATEYDGSIPFTAYLHAVAVHAAHRAVFSLSAPVTGSSHRPSNLAGLFRADLEVEGEEGGTYENPGVTAAAEAPGHAWAEAAAPSPERALGAMRFIQQVHLEVERVVGAECAAFAFGVLGGEWSPAEIAAAHGIPVVKVYRLRCTVHRRLANDPALARLWSQL